MRRVTLAVSEPRFMFDGANTAIRLVPFTMTHRSWLRIVAVLVVMLTLASSCAKYGPTQYALGSFDYGTDSSGQRTAIVVGYHKYHNRTDQADVFFPGQSVDIAVGALAWECDSSLRQSRSLGLVPFASGGATRDSVIVAGWDANSFDIVYASGENVLLHTTTWTTYRVSLTGGATSVASADTVATSQTMSSFCSTQLDSLRAVPLANLK